MDEQTGCGFITGCIIIIGLIVGGCMLHNSLQEEAKRTPRFVASVSLANAPAKSRTYHPGPQGSKKMVKSGKNLPPRCLGNPYAEPAARHYGVPVSIIQCIHGAESSCGTGGLGKGKSKAYYATVKPSVNRPALKKLASHLGVSVYSLTSNGCGAMGPFQYIARTWMNSGFDADNDGIASPYSLADATWTTARRLKKVYNKYGTWQRAIRSHNHSDRYVKRVAVCAGY